MKEENKLPIAILLFSVTLMMVLVSFGVVTWLYPMMESFCNMDDWDNDPETGSPIPVLILINAPVVAAWIVFFVKAVKQPRKQNEISD